MTTNSLTSCCESNTRSISDSSAQTPVYCPVYESRLLATARHELSSAAALGVYGNPYTSSQGYGNYVTYGADASAFYSLVSLKHIQLCIRIIACIQAMNLMLRSKQFCITNVFYIREKMNVYKFLKMSENEPHIYLVPMIA